jgi:hypothetical protein
MNNNNNNTRKAPTPISVKTAIMLRNLILIVFRIRSLILLNISFLGNVVDFDLVLTHIRWAGNSAGNAGT